LVYQFIVEENFCTVVEELFHYHTKVFSPSTFISADFLLCILQSLVFVLVL
jgi:hypothetical protein